jgi:hypothetical protein
MSKQTLSGIFGLVSILIVSPIWYYLLYKLLSISGATELMWFLYYIYVPVGIILALIKSQIDKKELR